jgi:alkaline phosphatase D
VISRRRFVLGSLALGVPVPRLVAAADPFALGVASGYPTPGGMTLWTRLLGPEAPARVTWEIATDDAMRTIVRSGETLADPAWAHSVHVDVDGLEPGRWYWYRFRAAGAESPIGRTRTAPALDAAAPRLRFAFGSCQQYEQGYYEAYRHLVADAPDLVVFLGDYIYEVSWGKEHVRSHGAPEPHTLDEYRARYALYKSEPDLQAAHAAAPWIATWDDHEVDNDYADDRPEDGMEREAFLARRAAAYRAYYEHMPLPARMRPEGARMRLHTTVDWGRLARFHVLDTRQYRSWQACPRPQRRAGSNTVNVEHCPRLDRPGRSMLGRAQERWLHEALDAGSAWSVIAQTTIMAQVDRLGGPGRSAWTDGWDGYPAARRRLLEALAEKRARNPVVIGGDVHTFHVCDLKADFDDERSPALASEFVGTSITSQGWPQDRVDAYVRENPHIHYAEGRHRGYTRVEVTPKLWRADLRGMDTVKTRGAACRTLASFVVEDGRPGPVKAI